MTKADIIERVYEKVGGFSKKEAAEKAVRDEKKRIEKERQEKEEKEEQARYDAERLEALKPDVEKIKTLIDVSGINTLTVIIMEVPCCGGLLSLAKEAADQAKRKIPIKKIIVGIQGTIKSEEWL